MECVRIPFTDGKHQENRQDVCIYDVLVCAVCGLLSNQHIEFAIAQRCLLRYPNSYKTVTPAAKPQGVIKAPH